MLITRLILTAITVALSYLIFKWLFKLIEKSVEKLGKELQMRNTIRFFLGLIIAVIAIMVVLDIWDLNLAPMLAGVGIGGLVVGLALQEPLSNFFSGIFLLVSRAVKEGEALEVGGVSGTVEVVNLNHTVIKTWDGKRVMIPNRSVWNDKIIHFWPSSVRRQEITVGVPYSADLRKVVEIFQKALEDEETVEKDPAPAIVFSGFNSSSIDFVIRFWVNRDNFFEGVKRLAFRIKDYLEKEGIYIPFPQLDVHFDEEFLRVWKHEGPENKS
ncbi:MscS Mechanosensitive ion channel [Thermotoga neapolitana DSM 4359]|uniref:MscS Mechanosensitive ion channel n=1 Tax=Thermotoga neapolitana (strain ATCC 49049 / DSM 4359 / NBRC 107923 / NS-E) TaxID=309803 RepID=B9K8N9_THENN|nr:MULTISPECIES: mechanosensitive ion channel family protein [Thermotoga]ACM23322.1 MscS Mechanosensitive ion channel [Thermotoga neapolitana DSM 4359]AJG41237.1 mechanosensitive ion channel protein [Thermotoga sp. RQ7]MDK2785832.1 small conductance mechanosensitive channel [Thermotoga sp.]MDK2949531.1 small conductance mechanosensitive channel [Thermotoga sp.]